MSPWTGSTITICYTIAREGSIAKACKQLHLTQPTISAQLRALGEYLGEQLFLRSARSELFV